MSILEFPGNKRGSSDGLQMYHVMIEYEGANGESHIAEDIGYLTTIGGFICISKDLEQKDGYYLPPVMIAFERVIRIDSDETSTVN
jgi:hypothetical protein